MADETAAEIPCWIFGQLKWVSGINRNTTAEEVVRALFKALTVSYDPTEFVLIEQWRKMERRLNNSRRILKVWEAWGEDKSEVRFIVKRQDPSHLTSTPDVDRTKKKKHSQRLTQTRKLDTVHPRRLYDEKEVSKESIQQLMKIIIAQGTTIQSQLQSLRDREKAIENFEQKVHLLRMKESGKDYVLQTYLEQLPSTGGLNEDHQNSSGGLSGHANLEVSPKPTTATKNNAKFKQQRSNSEDRLNTAAAAVAGKSERSRKEIGGLSFLPSLDIPPPDQVKGITAYYEGVCRLNDQLQEREEQILKLTRQTKRHRDRSNGDGKQASNSDASESHLPPSSVPDLEEILRLPLANLERELFVSRQEYRQLVASIDATIAESKRIQADLTAIQERCSAGDIYITTLETDLETAECEGEQLQREFDWILSLPPSAFASQEMLDWLKKDRQYGEMFESDSEFGLELTTSSSINISSCSPEGDADDSNILLPDQIHPSVMAGANHRNIGHHIGSTANNVSTTIGRQSRPNADTNVRSCSTGSTSSGISVGDNQSLTQSPEPSVGSSGVKCSPSPPALPPKQRNMILAPPRSVVGKDCQEDNNSDTGLSSLNSSGEEQIYCLDTLV